MDKSAERTINAFLGLALLLFVYVSPAAGAVPKLLNYQGFLTSASGTPINGTVTMALNLYNVVSGGVALYTETQSVTVTNGVFDVTLGAVTPLTLPFDMPYYLGVTVGGDAEMTPRQTVTASPYALKADDALGLGGLPPSRYVASNANNDVGIGTGAPTARLNVVGGGFPNNVRIADNNAIGTALDLANTSTGGRPWRLQSMGAGVSGRVGNLEIWEASAALNPAIAIEPNGNVGIGTTSPSNTLDVNGAFRAFNAAGGNVVTETVGGTNSWAKFWVRTPAQQWSIGSSTNFNGNQLYFSNESIGGQIQMVIMPNGNVGIGTTNPTRGMLEINGNTGTATVGNPSYVLTSGGLFALAGSGPFGDISLYASGSIMGTSVYAFSDERMKRIEGRSNGAHDLATLAGIEITDYTYIDTPGRGTGKQKRVIGQQVESVYPQAVHRSTDVVPDIYKKAEAKDGWVFLTTNLKKGERVRLIGMKKDGIHEVQEVAPGKFRTDFTPDADHVFVYGREVRDFRNVDYEAIAMLNVSATQELNRRLEKQADELAAQAAELTAMKQQLKQMTQLADAQASLLAQVVGWAHGRGGIRIGQAETLALELKSALPDRPPYR